MVKSNYLRSKRLIEDALIKFHLDLSELTVLTEAASNHFVYTPLIVALGNAKKVYAVTKDSPYGSHDSVIESTTKLAEAYGVNDKIEYPLEKLDVIRNCDIVTNLGFLRPLDADVIGKMKKTAVIPAMYETWEVRETDIDLNACRKNEILVLGTNEHLPKLKTFQYCGPLIIKLMLELDIELIDTRVVVVGDGAFSEEISGYLLKMGIGVHKIFPKKKIVSKIDESRISSSDVIVFAELGERLLLGEGGLITLERLLSLNPSISLIHLAGNIFLTEVDKRKLPINPQRIKPAGFMSITTAYLGPKPIIDLHTAGLKVGEIMARNRLRGLTYEEAKKESLRDPLVQNF